MPRNKSFILVLISGNILLGCDKEGEPTPIPVVPAEISTPNEPNKTGSSFLNSERDKIDHDAKFQPKKEIDPHWIIFGNFKSPRPSTWTWTAPTSNMRIANYVLQSAGESESAELDITQFVSGDINITIDRLKKQFRSDGGLSLRPTITKTTVASLPTTLIELSGEYMGVGASYHLHNYTMLVALIQNDKETISLRLLGPTQEINAHKKTWNSFLEDLTLVGEN
ncbi:MAG: hypothetical protein HOC93_02800 [Phycisphaerae bacterium]|nr:hypothetical protein [Phycisphaerae bacterium]